MSFPHYENSHVPRERRLLLFQLHSSPQSEHPIGSNGSVISPPINTHSNDLDVDPSQASEYSLLRHEVPNNFQNKTHHVNDDVIIPIPNWPTALKEWGACWDVHVYGVAVLFLALTFLSAAIFIRFRARVLRFQIVLNTLVLLMTSGMFRATFLLIDAYGHQDRMTGYLVGIMTQAVYPLLCACYGLTQVMLVKVTNVDVGPSKFRSLSSLLGCTLGYLFLVVVIESIVYYEPHLKLLLLLDSGCFIAWALYLTITFICSGFKLSQYTNETKKARKELNVFSNQRRSASNTNALSTISNSSNDTRFGSGPVDSLDATPTADTTGTDFSAEMTTSASFPSSSSCSFSNYAQNKTGGTIRLSRPKMKIADHNHMTIALVTDDDDESTSSTDVDQSSHDASQFRTTHKVFTRRQKKRSSQSRTKAEYKSKHDAAIDKLLTTSKDIDAHKVKTSADKTSKYCPLPTEEKVKLNGSINKNNVFDVTQGNCINSCEDRHALRSPEDFETSFQNGGDGNAQSCGTFNIDKNNKDGQDIGQGDLYDENGLLETSREEKSTDSCAWSKSKHFDYVEMNNEVLADPDNISFSAKENGYLADTENVLTFSTTVSKSNTTRLRNSGKCLDHPTDDDTSSNKDGFSDDDDKDSSSPHLTLSDRLRSDAPAIISLFRIRQSKMVQRAVHLTYFLTFLFTFACLMQLYTVFGVYGVLGKIQRPHPWPWLVFHSIFRLLECSIGFTCASIAFITLNHRHQRAKRRLQQQQQQQQQEEQQARPIHQQSQHSQQQNHSLSPEQHSSLINTRECVV